MYSYESMRQKNSTKVCQTIDGPILVYDYFQLSEVFLALGALLVFGIVVHSLELAGLSMLLILGVLPAIRRRNKKGIVLHYPYRRFGMNLPGIVNPRGNNRFSD